MRPTRAEIDLAAIRHNIGQIRNHVGPQTKLIAVVKANAYGHGAVTVSREVLGSRRRLPGSGYSGRRSGIADCRNKRADFCAWPGFAGTGGIRG